MFVYGPHVFKSSDDEDFEYDSDCDPDVLLEVSHNDLLYSYV